MESLVSIIMPTYNCGTYIALSIESVLKQTYKNWELIIVDDCSSDNTPLVVDTYASQDKRILYVQSEENRGPAYSRNEAVRIAHGTYIAFLDSDDIWYADKLTVQIRFMEQNKYLISCTSYELINENGEELNRVIASLTKVNYNRLLLDCPVGNSTVIYNASVLGKFETPDIRKRNDDALWLKLLKKEKYIYGLQTVLMKYRVRQHSVSSNKVSLIKYHWQLYRKIEHLSIFRSSFHIGYWIFIKVFQLK